MTRFIKSGCVCAHQTDSHHRSKDDDGKQHETFNGDEQGADDESSAAEIAGGKDVMRYHPRAGAFPFPDAKEPENSNSNDQGG